MQTDSVYNWVLRGGGLLICLYLPLFLLGQERLDRRELEARIELTGNLLSETRHQEARSLVTLRMLNRQIEMRRELLVQLTEEITDQQAEIEKLELIRCEMEADVTRIKDNYRRNVRETYQNLGSDNVWLAILSANSLSDAYYRLQYFRQFSTYRRKQLTLLQRTQVDLDAQSERLNEEFERKEVLRSRKQNELIALEDDRQQQRSLYRALRQEAGRYQRLLAQERAQLKILIREAESLYQASSEKEMAGDYARAFEERRGQLAWPVPPARCLVVGHFGHSKDVFGNSVTNDGLYLRTPQEQEVSAVYAGRVTGMTHLPVQGGWVVIVEHGRYRTVYANLEKVYATEGQLLSTGQPLGRVRTDHRTGETVLQFLVYTPPNRFLDPEKWLE